MNEEQMKQLGLIPIEDYISEDFGAESTPERMEVRGRRRGFHSRRETERGTKEVWTYARTTCNQDWNEEKLFFTNRGWIRCATVYAIPHLCWVR